MAYNFSHFDSRITETTEWLKSELATIRTGRAMPAVLDRVQVNSYGSRMAIKELATISVEDARTVRVVPWDTTQLVAIEKAVIEANLGLSVVTDEKGLRVIFPELTGERREQLVKVIGQKQEEARITIKSERQKAIEDIEKQEKDGDMSEDDKYRNKEEIQKRIEKVYKTFEELAEKKETDIKTI